MGAALKESVPAGVGRPNAEKGTKDWADNVRLYSLSALDRAEQAPERFAEIHGIIVSERAWALMNRPDGEPFGSVEEFSAAPRPYGWGRPYAAVRPFLEIAESKRKVKVAGVSVSVDAEKSLAVGEVPADGRAARERCEDGTFQTGPLGPNGERSGTEKRLARIARDAPGDVKDLFRAGLISDRAAAALSPAKKTPEKAAVIHAAVEQANAVVKAHGAPADAKSKRALKKKVDAVVRETLAPIAPPAVRDAGVPSASKPDAESDFRAAFTRLALDRRAPAIRWALGMLTAAERASLVET